MKQPAPSHRKASAVRFRKAGQPARFSFLSSFLAGCPANKFNGRISFPKLATAERSSQGRPETFATKRSSNRDTASDKCRRGARGELFRERYIDEIVRYPRSWNRHTLRNLIAFATALSAPPTKPADTRPTKG